MYYYVVWNDLPVPPNISWKEVTTSIPVFDSQSELAITPDLSRFEVLDRVLPYLTYLPTRIYRRFTPEPDIHVYLDNNEWVFIQTSHLESEGKVRQLLNLWNES